ncbi:methyltransferase family protein [Kordiimonas pumila]|uniref:Methyltransferase family protein n=1 Tax=Kordiimonas pumila TaxID=2161677 RepID=A0ABV7D813_9PROT|nr:isoprenylcysteine carboxylmethyltransferase family protein [Kordiimonas pumila]
MTHPKTDTSPPYGVPRILPPYVFIAAMVAIYYLGKWETGEPVAYSLSGGLVMALGLLIAIVANRQFKRARTTILPGDKPTKLVTTGMFRRSRNPMYIAMTVVLAGYWSWVGGYSPFGVLVLFLLVMRYRFIAMEEKHLLHTFGADYQAYCMRTRRWL